MDDERGPTFWVDAEPTENLTPFPDPVIEQPTHRVCPACKEPRELRDFVKHVVDGKDKWKGQCRMCRRSKKMETINLRRKDELLNTIMETTGIGIARSMKPEKLPSLSDVAKGMIQRFGGIDLFLTKWHYNIVAKELESPGCKTVLDQYYAIAKMTGEVEKIETARRAVDRLSEEEMAEEINAYIKRMTVDAEKPKEPEVKHIEYDPDARAS